MKEEVTKQIKVNDKDDHVLTPEQLERLINDKLRRAERHHQLWQKQLPMLKELDLDTH